MLLYRYLPGWLLAASLLGPSVAVAGPWLEPGDMALRHDIQVLADAGVLPGPVTTWPLSWGEVARHLGSVPTRLADHEAAAFVRVQQQARRATRTGQLGLHARAAVASDPRQIRSFDAIPREDAEFELGVTWTGNRAAFRLQGQVVDEAEDQQEWRGDGSYLGLALGNWMFAASISDRWWGPGWQGSLIMGNNVRPMPGFSVERNLTAPFESRWLRWIGPWDLALFWNFFEHDRDRPHTRMFGARVSFKPVRSLEIGLSRTMMWCGAGRPCDFDAFTDVLVGNDNVGVNVSAEEEPGNQLGGFDLRWSSQFLGRPLAVYGQFIGEDKTNDFWPSDWLGQLGIETTGSAGRAGSYRLFLEWSDTECDFRLYRSLRNDSGTGSPNCAYNHPLYAEGYRYRGRPLGHSIDNDASVFTVGAVLIDRGDNLWMATVLAGNLNRHGPEDPRNTVAAVKTRYGEAELRHRRAIPIGTVDVGVAWEYRENVALDADDDDWRAFLQLRYEY